MQKAALTPRHAPRGLESPGRTRITAWGLHVVPAWRACMEGLWRGYPMFRQHGRAGHLLLHGTHTQTYGQPNSTCCWPAAGVGAQVYYPARLHPPQGAERMQKNTCGPRGVTSIPIQPLAGPSSPPSQPMHGPMQALAASSATHWGLTAPRGPCRPMRGTRNTHVGPHASHGSSGPHQ